VPSRAWDLRIQDILEAIACIQQATAGMSYEEFEDLERLTLHGILYNFMIVGEAATNVNESIQSRYPQIPWRLMADMRNVMTHEYFQVNQMLVWNTIENHLPSVVPLLEELLQQERGEQG
jgi:uncharacterized protein with HEPN domain